MSLDIDLIKTRFIADGFVCQRNDGELEPDELLRVASAFGDLLETRRHTYKHKALQMVSDHGLFRNGEVPWHNDWSYGSGQYFGSLLYNRENAAAAPTCFVDMEKVYATLPVDLTESLRDVTGIYSPPDEQRESCFTAAQLRALDRMTISRPFVFDHPLTGRPVLYFSPGTLRRIENGPVDIDALVRHCETFAWDHDWQPNDLLLFDNLRFMHRRPAFEGSRELLRIQFDPDYAALASIDGDGLAAASA